MSKFKLLPNRISKTLPPDALDQMQSAFKILMDLLGDDTPMTEEEYKKLSKIADLKKGEADDKFAIIQNNPEFLETPPLEEVTKDKVYYEFCDRLEGLTNQLISRRLHEQNIAGAEYYNAVKFYEDSVDYQISKGNAKAALVAKQLEDVQRTRPSGPKASVTAPQSAVTAPKVE